MDNKRAYYSIPGEGYGYSFITIVYGENMKYNFVFRYNMHMDGWKEGRMDGRIDWMDGWIDRSINLLDLIDYL